MESETESYGAASAGGVEVEWMGFKSEIDKSLLKDVLVKGKGGGSIGKVKNIISKVTTLCESVGAQSKERE